MTLLRPGRQSVGDDPDSELVDRLRAGDADAFVALAGKYQAVMLSVALGYAPGRAVAEEVVQDAWVGVLRGIGNFEHRSTFRTWLIRIVINRAVSAAARERRSVPVNDIEPVINASRFNATGTWADDSRGARTLPWDFGLGER